MPTVRPTKAGPALNTPYAQRPMSSAAMPGSRALPMGMVMASAPSGPGFGPMPKCTRLSQ